MKRCFGIIHTENGMYVMAEMFRHTDGAWTCLKVRKWQSASPLKRMLLLQKAIYCGVPTWYRPYRSSLSDAHFIQALPLHDEDTADEDAHFSILAREADCTFNQKLLRLNLNGLVSEDIFLLTIPFYCSQCTSDTFISICRSDTLYYIGVVVKRTLLTVFRMISPEPEHLPLLLGRIGRYWHLRFPHVSFPDTIVTIGNSAEMPDAFFERPPVRVLSAENALSHIKAMGVALAPLEKTTAVFAGPTPETTFRTARTLVYVAAGILLFCGASATAIFSGVNFWFQKQKAVYEEEYRNVIAHNQEIKKLTERNNELAGTILRLEDTFSRRTQWAKFLHEIADKRPANLYFERIGSEPLATSTTSIRIAFAGWTPKETSVTDFIGTLQDMPYVTQITLSSMERDNKNTSLYGFRIVCTLLLSELL